MGMLKRGLRTSRCVVAFWCGLAKIGAQIVVHLQVKTGETGHCKFVTALGRIHTKATCRRSAIAMLIVVRAGESFPEQPSRGAGGWCWSSNAIAASHLHTVYYLYNVIPPSQRRQSLMLHRLLLFTPCHDQGEEIHSVLVD